MESYWFSDFDRSALLLRCAVRLRGRYPTFRANRSLGVWHPFPLDDAALLCVEGRDDAETLQLMLADIHGVYTRLFRAPDGTPGNFSFVEILPPDYAGDSV